MQAFIERLKDLRIEHGLKQEEIAKKLNISTSAYGYYEQGRNEPSLETLCQIAKTYSVSTDYLLGLTNTPKQKVYSISDELTFVDQEMAAIQHMKQRSLLEEISKDPVENVERLHRYWNFIKRELSHRK
ncbi:MAG TPA: helix-turn-helix transcriptional regulator [Bacillota bacterium]